MLTGRPSGGAGPEDWKLSDSPPAPIRDDARVDLNDRELCSRLKAAPRVMGGDRFARCRRSGGNSSRLASGRAGRASLTCVVDGQPVLRTFVRLTMRRQPTRPFYPQAASFTSRRAGERQLHPQQRRPSTCYGRKRQYPLSRELTRSRDAESGWHGLAAGKLLRLSLAAAPRREGDERYEAFQAVARRPVRCLGWDRSADRVRARAGTHGQDTFRSSCAARVLGRVRVLGRLIMPGRRRGGRSSALWGRGGR